MFGKNVRKNASDQQLFIIDLNYSMWLFGAFIYFMLTFVLCQCAFKKSIMSTKIFLKIQ